MSPNRLKPLPVTKPRYTNPPICALMSESPSAMVISTRPFRRLLILNTAVRICSTCFAISTTVSFSSARTFSCSAAKPSSVQTGPPLASINLSTPQEIQSSISSSTLPYGLKYSPSLALFGNFSCKYLIGDGIFSSSRRRRPFHIACFCSSGLSNSLIATLSRSSTSAGHAFTL